MAQGRVLDKIAEIADRPLFKLMAKAAAAAVREQAKESGTVARATPALETEIATNLAADPVVVNETSNEVPRASRTATGLVHGILGSLGTLILGLSDLIGTMPLIEPQWLAWVLTLVGATSTGGGIFGLWGRFKEGLPPMTRKWYNPFSWAAPKRMEDALG